MLSVDSVFCFRRSEVRSSPLLFAREANIKQRRKLTWCPAARVTALSRRQAHPSRQRLPYLSHRTSPASASGAPPSATRVASSGATAEAIAGVSPHFVSERRVTHEGCRPHGPTATIVYGITFLLVFCENDPAVDGYRRERPFPESTLRERSRLFSSALTQTGGETEIKQGTI